MQGAKGKPWSLQRVICNPAEMVMHEDTKLVQMQTPGSLIPTGHTGDKCEKSDLENQGSSSAPESKQGHPWGWASPLMAEVLGTRAITSLTPWAEMPSSFAYIWKEAVKGWLAPGLRFSFPWCIRSTNSSLHASGLPQLPSDTCHISCAQLCTLEDAPPHPGAIITMSLSVSLSGYPTHSYARPPTASWLQWAAENKSGARMATT